MKKQDAISKVNPEFLKGVCHRGLHNKEFSENGLKAFKNAIDHNMPFEFDVHLTKDGQIVVFHDSEMERMTGKKGIIEDLTLEEIKRDYTLLDGEKIPTLKEVFDLNQEKVPMVLELKVFRRNYKALAAKVSQELEVIKDKKNLILISFDPRGLFPFKKHGFIRQLLVTVTHEYVYAFRHFFEGVDLEHCMLKEKRIQRYARTHFTNIWTVDSEELLDSLKPELSNVDTITFQFIQPEKISALLK
ncbi:MAG: hypothetical protein K5839_04895 [Treponemataceae bacterium]|nr:hypothetical protein [Treponemataceae bacterium]